MQIRSPWKKYQRFQDNTNIYFSSCRKEFQIVNKKNYRFLELLWFYILSNHELIEGKKLLLIFKRGALVYPAPQPAALSTWLDREKARLGSRVQMGFKWAHRCIQQLHTVPEKGPFLPIDGWITRLLHGFFIQMSIDITSLCAWNSKWQHTKEGVVGEAIGAGGHNIQRTWSPTADF